MELLIHLENPENDIDRIESALEKFSCSLIVEDGKVVVKTCSLVGDIDLNDTDAVEKVWESVKDFIDIINGSAIVEGFSMSPINLHYVKYTDNSGDVRFFPNTGKAYMVLPGFRGNKPDISSFIPLALRDKAVAKVLRLFSRDLDWVNLYRIYEVMSEDMGGLTDEAIKIFKASANNSNVTGDSSRHGKINVGSPEITMRLADAQHLIKTKIREWIYDKIRNTT